MFSNTGLNVIGHFAVIQPVTFRIEFRIKFFRKNIAIHALEHKKAILFGLNLENN
jgi:hypothetical protein